jgi:hypothetical protein
VLDSPESRKGFLQVAVICHLDLETQIEVWLRSCRALRITCDRGLEYSLLQRRPYRRVHYRAEARVSRHWRCPAACLHCCRRSCSNARTVPLTLRSLAMLESYARVGKSLTGHEWEHVVCVGEIAGRNSHTACIALATTREHALQTAQ